MNNIQDKLIEKSREAFCMAIELYNKSTIKYRVEGFALFICNAWELMLKYYGIKENPKFCYQHQLTHTYGYSIQTIDFIVEEIKKDPDNIIQNLKEYLAKK